jgi:hypothetical protein
LRYATVRIQGRFAVVKIPIATFLPFSRVFVKFKRPTIFLDDSGWREVPLAKSARNVYPPSEKTSSLASRIELP